MHAFQTLQRQPFHHVKRKLRLALTAVITRLQCRDGSQDSSHFPQLQSQSPAHLWKHGHILMEDHVWIYYRVASYPSVESVLPEAREGLDMQEASDLRRATRRTPPYPLGLCRCVQDAGKHHPAVDTSGGIIRANGLAQTNSIIAVRTEATFECAGGYQASVPRSR